jgi:hypothetical protein
MYKQESAKFPKTDIRLKHDPLPEERLQAKMDYFYLNRNPE